MDTLTNVDIRRSGYLTPSARLTSCTISSETNIGVSVENASFKLTARYILRGPYSREQKVHDWLKEQGFEVYIPLHCKEVVINGKRKRVKAPLLHNFIFIHANRTDIDLVMKLSSNKYFSYYYDHFKMDSFGKNPPLTIPQQQMDNSIRLTSVESDHILFVTPQKCHFENENGDFVEVTNGLFEGVKGRVARVNRQRWIVVELDSIGCVTTAFIPKAFVKKII
mgnify:CR=1 FL=1